MTFLKFGDAENMIVFLHGWGADKNSFLWLKDYFVLDWSMIFVDFDGFGDSPEPEKEMFVRDYAINLKKIIDEFNPQRLVLVGHSFGGRVAIKFSFLYQTLYENLSLVLVDSAGILPRRNLMYYFKIHRFKRLKKKAQKNKKFEEKLKDFGSSDYRVLSQVMKRTFVNVVNEDLSNDARFVSGNTIIVWGDKDKETKTYMARKLARLIKGSKLYFLRGAGHFSFLEKKEDFVIILDTFLKNI